MTSTKLQEIKTIIEQSNAEVKKTLDFEFKVLAHKINDFVIKYLDVAKIKGYEIDEFINNFNTDFVEDLRETAETFANDTYKKTFDIRQESALDLLKKVEKVLNAPEKEFYQVFKLTKNFEDADILVEDLGKKYNAEFEVRFGTVYSTADPKVHKEIVDYVIWSVPYCETVDVKKLVRAHEKEH